MPAVHSPSGSGQWSDPQQHGHEHRARHGDVAPEPSWGYPSDDRPESGFFGSSASPGYESHEPAFEPRGTPSRGYRAEGYEPSYESGAAGHYQPEAPAVSYRADHGGDAWETDRPAWGAPGPAWGTPESAPSPPPDPRRRSPDRTVPASGNPESDAAGSSGKSGRNLPAAIAVGVTLGAAVIGSLYFWRPAFVLLAVLAIAAAIWEMARALEPIEARPPLAPLLLGGTAIVVLAWFGGLEAMVLGLVLTVVAVLVWRLAEGPAGYQRDITAATLIAAYVPFLAGFAVLLAQPEDGASRVMITLAAAVLSDVGGYAMGALFGRHPMAPTVSPKKSWEGFAGSLGASAVGGAVLLELMLDQPWWQGVLFGIGVALAAVLGDLAESLMKRDLGIKDMGRLLPGHGGLMDRLDSLLLAVPTGYLLLVWFAPPVG